MEEIIAEFTQDCDQIILDLEDTLEYLEDHTHDFKKLEEFGQKVDRIMGAAKSLDFHIMGEISEFCKSICYKAGHAKNETISNIVIAFLFDAVEGLKIITKALKETGNEELPEVNKKTIMGRLHFISDRLKEIRKSSVAIDEADLIDLAESLTKVASSK